MFDAVKNTLFSSIMNEVPEKEEFEDVTSQEITNQTDMSHEMIQEFGDPRKNFKQSLVNLLEAPKEPEALSWMDKLGKNN